MKDIYFVILVALGIALSPIIIPVLLVLFPIWVVMAIRMHYIRKERGWY